MTSAEYDIVRLRRAMPEQTLGAGATSVVSLGYEGGRAFEVEFCDDEGNTIALVTLSEDALES